MNLDKYGLLFIWILSLLWKGAKPWEAWAVVSSLIWLAGTCRPFVFYRKGCEMWWIWGAWLFFTGVFSPEPWTSAGSLLQRWTVLLFFTLAVGVWEEDHRKAWLASLWGMGIFLGLWAFTQVAFNLKGMPWWLPSNPNYTSCVMAAVFTSSLVFILTKGSEIRGWRVIVFSVLALLALGILWKFMSRGALLSSFLVSLVLTGYCKGVRGLSFFLVLISVGLWVLPQPVLDLFSKVQSESFSFRIPILRVGLDMAKDFPWVGVGPGCFERGYFLHNFPAFNGLSFYSRSTNHAHSELIHLAAESGWFAALLFVWAFGQNLFLVLKSPRLDRDPVQIAAGTAAATVFLHSWFDGILYLPGIQFLLFSALACAVSKSASAQKPFLSSPWLKKFSLVGFCLCVSINLFHRIAPSEVWVAPAKFDFYERAAQRYLLGKPSNPALAWGTFNRAVELNPTNALLWAQRAEVAQGVGDWREAVRSAYKAVGLEPNFISAQLLLSAGLLHLARQENRVEWLERARAAWESARRIRDEKKSWVIQSRYDRILLLFDEKQFLSIRKDLP
ncbi:MAG: O-antigen ligase family protein [Elusimicrobia bacterium]|nr:O-antigen ligase family protein [Elusimicrobiota bacterium]